MSGMTSRFLLTDYIATGTILNGTGGGEPSRYESSPYVMERLQNPDRNLVWKLDGTQPDPFDVDIDLGSARAVSCAAVLGFRPAPGVQMYSVSVQYATASPGGPWTIAATLTMTASPRDIGAIFGSVTKRYWRFHFYAFTGSKIVSVGRIVLGTPVDLGIMHSAGGVSSPFRNRIEQGQQNGSYVINDLGDPGRDFTLPVNQSVASMRTTLEGLSSYPGSVIYIDPEDNFYEVLVRGGRVNGSRQFTSLWTEGLEMTRLP